MKNPILQEKNKVKLCRETDLCRAQLHFSVGKRSSGKPLGNHPHTWMQSCIPVSGGPHGLVAALSH